jgi:hypothetical protein
VAHGESRVAHIECLQRICYVTTSRWPGIDAARTHEHDVVPRKFLSDLGETGGGFGDTDFADERPPAFIAPEHALGRHRLKAERATSQPGLFRFLLLPLPLKTPFFGEHLVAAAGFKPAGIVLLIGIAAPRVESVVRGDGPRWREATRGHATAAEERVDSAPELHCAASHQEAARLEPRSKSTNSRCRRSQRKRDENGRSLPPWCQRRERRPLRRGQ